VTAEEDGRTKGFVRTPGTELYDLTEHELVREILFGSARLYEFFGFVMTDVHGLRSEDGWEYLFYGNVPRTDLGLSREGQPGDIDLLIVPYRGTRVHIGKAAAIEIKRLSLKAPRWDKSTDRYGITQANGLLEAGFPYVGILHLIVHAEGPAANRKEMMVGRVIGPDGRIEFEDDEATDMTGSQTSDRQLGRLMARNPDPVIGLNCVSVADVTFQGRPGVMVGMPNGRPAKRNPQTSERCLRGIADFVRQIHGRMAYRPVDAVAE
jgi:hypothetical protein